MKIVFVNSARKVSGAEEYLLDLATNLSDQDYSPIFFVKGGGVLEDCAGRYGYPCHAVFKGNPLMVPLRIASALVKVQPGIILIGRDHNIYPIIAGYVLALPFLTNKPRIIAALHTPTGRRYPFAINFLDGIIASSDYTGQTFYSANSGWQQIATTIHCGINLPLLRTDKADPDRTRKLLIGKSFPIIGMVGELWKNQTELIDVAAILIKQYPDLTIAIVGGGDDSELLEKISRFKLGRNFVLTGRIPREQVVDLFYDLDLSVSTHRNEGFGIVHIESLAASTPVVAYNSGGLTEILKNGGGVLVDGDTQQFSTVIANLLSNNEERSRIGKECRKVVEDYFTIESMVRNHTDFFRRIGSDT